MWKRPSRSTALALVTVAGISLAACAPIVENRGNTIEDQRLSEIQPGASTRNDVAVVLGPPTTVSTFDDSKWYYIGQRTETRAFLKPQVTDRRIVEVEFDDSDRVASIREYDESDGREVQTVSRITPTEGRSPSLLEQLMGNLGRVGAGGDDF